MELILAAFQLNLWRQLIQPAFQFIAFVIIPIATIIALYMYGQKFKKDSEGEILSNSYTMLVHALLFVFCIWGVFLLIDTYFPDIDSNQSQNETQAIKENNQKDSKQSKAYQTLANEIPKMIVGGLVTAILTLIVFGIIINNRPPSQADKDKEALKLLTDFIAGTEFTKARLIIQKHLIPWRCSFDKDDKDNDTAEKRLEKFARQHLVKIKLASGDDGFFKFEEYPKYWEVRDPRTLVDSSPNNSATDYQITYDEAFSIRKVLGFFWLVNTASEKGMIGKQQDIFNYHYAWYWQNIFRFRFATCIDNGFCRPLSHFFNQGKQGVTNHFFGVARSEFQAFLRGFLNDPNMKKVKEEFEKAVIYLYVTVCCEIWCLCEGYKIKIEAKDRRTTLLSDSRSKHKFPIFSVNALSTKDNKVFFKWEFAKDQKNNDQANKDEQSKIKHILEYFNELHFILKDCVEASCFSGLKEIAEGKKDSIQDLDRIFKQWDLSSNGLLDKMICYACENDSDFTGWRLSWNIEQPTNEKIDKQVNPFVRAMLCSAIEYHLATKGEGGTQSNINLRPMFDPSELYNIV